MALHGNLPQHVVHWIQSARPLLSHAEGQPVHGLVGPFNLHAIVASGINQLLVAHLIRIVVETYGHWRLVLVVRAFSHELDILQSLELLYRKKIRIFVSTINFFVDYMVILGIQHETR